MTRAEVWLAQVGRKTRPVLILTRPEVIDVRALVTVAEITTTIRGLAVEVEINHHDVGLDKPLVINCDGIHTITQSSLTNRLGIVDEPTIAKVCSAVSHAIGC